MGVLGSWSRGYYQYLVMVCWTDHWLKTMQVPCEVDDLIDFEVTWSKNIGPANLESTEKLNIVWSVSWEFFAEQTSDLVCRYSKGVVDPYRVIVQRSNYTRYSFVGLICYFSWEPFVWLILFLAVDGHIQG